MNKKILASLTALLVGVGLNACGGDADAGSDTTVLRIAYQDIAFPALIEESGVLEGADFDVEWSNLTGPAANLQAVYSDAVDLGHVGDTSLTIEQGNAKEEWTEETVPLQIVAGWRNFENPKYPPLITAVRSDSGVDEITDGKGKKWGFNFGGYNHAQFLVGLVQAGLTEDDIEASQFADGATSAAAFNSGQVDIYSGQHAAVLESLSAGEGKIILTDADTGIPALNVWTARTSTLEDEEKVAALEEFFERMSGYWEWHDENRDQVEAVLKTALKIDEERVDLEYELRRGAFRVFDDELIAQEQQVAQTLYDGKAIPNLPEVEIEYNPLFHEQQQAISTDEFKARK
ncbi:ABC transporter substrate-binding protein [Nocardioides campestrisoli]|uniref:ABC transporter substrate-binding protein n=1 Tax=Nocardioides campestrisoli TaxID=2736757 RepID=UPI00163D7F3F|nr:ABC transporter substrate-binding protein [Nocardioides campestrisoli]